MGRQHKGMGRSGVRQVLEGSGEQGKMEKTGCKIISGDPTTLAVKGLMMMMMMMMMMNHRTAAALSICNDRTTAVLIVCNSRKKQLP